MEVDAALTQGVRSCAPRIGSDESLTLSQQATRPVAPMDQPGVKPDTLAAQRILSTMPSQVIRDEASDKIVAVIIAVLHT